MESWLPLFDIFMNSSSPETEASLWLRRNFNASSSTSVPSTITSNSFLRLLTKPLHAVVSNSLLPPPPSTNRVIWMQTLPNLVQSRILSFLLIERLSFQSVDLVKLARCVIQSEVTVGVDFWVKKAARQLLDKMSESDYDWVSSFNLDSQGGGLEDDFDSLPNCLHLSNSEEDSVLPWLPISTDDLNSKMNWGTFSGEVLMTEVENEEEEEEEQLIMTEATDEIDPDTKRRACHLKERILTTSTSESVALAKEIRQLCIQNRANSFSVLGFIQPWEADDETASILLSNLVEGNEDTNWPCQVLSSIILPKLLSLEEPSSRLLLNIAIAFCKLHHKAAADALLIPLIFKAGGINSPICDAIAKIMKECLHPVHVSSLCHKVLSPEETNERRFICLPCHRQLICNELVWTESTFILFHSVLNHNVHLTQDSIDELVLRVMVSAERYAKSLKFGNFLLCLVTKCGPLLKYHKTSLIGAVGFTNTLVTKSVLSKLASL